ncbi:MAG: hypothetical protein M3336_06135 [Chloroflexota bacterium]|nr:hypothetical protein [Chloroflexota bacterium]
MLDDSKPSPTEPARWLDAAKGVSAETLGMVREALRRRLTDDPHDGHLRAVLRRLSGEVKAKGLHGEHVVIMLKQIWSQLPEMWQALAAHERRLMLERVVTLCIEEFYAEE